MEKKVTIHVKITPETTPQRKFFPLRFFFLFIWSVLLILYYFLLLHIKSDILLFFFALHLFIFFPLYSYFYTLDKS